MDGPPPLEDCSDYIKQRQAKNKSLSVPSTAPITIKSIDKNPVKKQTTTDSSLLFDQQKPPVKKPTGLKSGFFNTKSTKKRSEKIETIKPKSSPLVIDSVQEALNGAMGKDSWTSPDFMKKIDENPVLGTSNLTQLT
jgi:hypothetical protein